MADDYEGVEVAGLAVVAADTGRIFLAQRSPDDSDDPDVRETWETVGGHLDDGETPWDGAVREFTEEIGFAPPEGQVTGGWRSDDGVYQGFVLQIPYEFNVSDWTPTDEVQAVGWFDQPGVEALGDRLRPEVRKTMNWALIFGEQVAASGWGAPSDNLKIVKRKETEMATAQVVDKTVDEDDDDDFDPDDFSDFDTAVDFEGHVPFHGVAIAFDQDTGDRRAFPSEGTVRVRAVPIPLMFAKRKGQGHDGAEITGLITRVTRDDEANLMRFSGYFADTSSTDDLIGLTAEFGRLNLSVDLDDVREVRHDETSGVTIFADSRIAGMTALAIGAFAETYIALGPSDNPEEDATPEEAQALVASAVEPDVASVEFARGPGWVTHPRATSRLHRYWTKGKGAAKIRWGQGGDFYRCRRLVGAKIAKNSPEDMRFINQICARWHKDAIGIWPGQHKTDLKASVAPSFEGLTASALAPLPAEWFTEPSTSQMTFTHDEATGLTRVSGMIAEWRRCHLGYDGRCVLPPRGGSYRLFRKGTITTSKGELPVGTLVFGTGHPELKTSIAEAQARYDNLGRAWAFVNVGENRQGIWYSGIVNPDLSAETVFALKAGGAVSGDWKAYEGRSELIAAVSVNVPGFPQPLVAAAFGENDEILAMTAAGIVMPEYLRTERLDQLRELALTVSRSDRIDTLKALIEGEI